ncbi:hypothetical protein Syun_031934 [Stephania yunnanensis]|uniref:Uncharacterized protein n=1 Tax=Stephania yunnanensis TaxID=152371 RepID=A0AAP0DTS6_9MAGN
MSSAPIDTQACLGTKMRGGPASIHGISKITLKVVVFHFRRRDSSHLSYTSQVISQSRTRVKLNRVFFPADSRQARSLGVVSLDSRQDKWESLDSFDARGRPSKEPFQVRPRQHAVARSRRGAARAAAKASRRVRTRTPCPPLEPILFPGYGSILPTSLAYILPSTAGRSPWRPDAVMSTTGANDTRSSGFSRAAGRTDTTNVRCSSSSPDPTSAEPFPGVGRSLNVKDNSSRGPRRRLRLPNVAVNRRVPVQNFNPIPFRSSRETRFRRGYPDS